MKVKITKLAACDNPKFPTPDMKDYTPGQRVGDGGSLPAEYWIEGDMDEKPTIGKHVSAMRSIRNGVKCLGFFRTSPVVKVKGNIFETANSIYEVEYLKDKKEKAKPTKKAKKQKSKNQKSKNQKRGKK